MIQAELKELGKIEISTTQRKELSHGDIRLKVISCAICGSDIRIYNYLYATLAQLARAPLL